MSRLLIFSGIQQCFPKAKAPLIGPAQGREQKHRQPVAEEEPRRQPPEITALIGRTKLEKSVRNQRNQQHSRHSRRGMDRPPGCPPAPRCTGRRWERAFRPENGKSDPAGQWHPKRIGSHRQSQRRSLIGIHRCADAQSRRRNVHQYIGDHAHQGADARRLGSPGLGTFHTRNKINPAMGIQQPRSPHRKPPLSAAGGGLFGPPF